MRAQAFEHYLNWYEIFWVESKQILAGLNSNKTISFKSGDIWCETSEKPNYYEQQFSDN